VFRTIRVERERISTVGRVGAAGCVTNERFNTVGRVAVAGCVAIERMKTLRRVAEAWRPRFGRLRPSIKSGDRVKRCLSENAAPRTFFSPAEDALKRRVT
jgi:hypothetical protein